MSHGDNCSNPLEEWIVPDGTSPNTTVFSAKGDDNEEIMRLLNTRLALGRQRYGHGVIIDEDPTKYGVGSNDWELMALEEMLDGLIYTTAAIIRLQRRKKQ